MLELSPDELASPAPEDRHVLALHLPDGRGFLFSFGQLADPSTEDLRDPDRLWDWGDDPDTDAVVLARDLDWADIAELLVLGSDALAVST